MVSDADGSPLVFDRNFLGVFEKLVQPGPPNNADHQSSPSELLDLRRRLESLDLESSDLRLDFRLSDLEVLDREVLKFDLLDFESVT